MMKLLYMYHKKNKTIIIIIYILMIISMISLLSSKITNFMMIKHILSSMIGIYLIHFLFTMPNIYSLSYILFILCFILDIYALIFGSVINGSKRWVRILQISFQPIEILKPTFMMINAKFIYYKEYIKSICYLLSIIIICILQPDFGSAFILIISYFAQMIIHSFSLMIILLLLMSIISILAIGYYFLPHIHNRITEFIFGNGDIFGIKYQVMKSLNAISHGGLFGTGYYYGKVKNILPDAHTDFIISCIAEEWGIITVVIILNLYTILLLNIISSILKCQNKMYILSSIGLIIQIMLHVIIHLYSATSLIPPKGTTLPFISYGGSAMIGFCLNIGLIIYMNKKENKFISAIKRLQ